MSKGKNIPVLIIIFCLNLCSTVFSINEVPENIYTGYGYVAGVYTVNATVINPANLYYLNRDEVYITFNKPFSFHSTAIGLSMGSDHYLGLAIITYPSFHQYRCGMNIFDFEHFKFGLTTGADREIIEGEKEKFGYALSSGVTLPLLKMEDSDFRLDIAGNFKNVFTVNDFETHKELTKPNLDLGLRSELFIQHLFINIGGNCFEKEWKVSASLEYLFYDFINIGVVYMDKDFGGGGTIGFENNYIGFAYLEDNYSISYSLTLGKAKIFKRRYKGPTITKEHLRIQRNLLQRGIGLYKEKKYDEAKKTWQGVIRIAPSTEYAKEARKYIKKVNNILRSINE